MRLLAVAILAGLLAPASAGAADVTISGCIEKTCIATGVVVTAAQGEVNRIHVTAEFGSVLVRDAGAPLRAGGGCAEEDGGVRCAGTNAAYVDAGDGDDELVLAPGRTLWDVSLDGGPGDDLVVGGDGNERLGGGLGRDSLIGGPGDDTLVGGDAKGSAEADRIEGGPGIDIVDYTDRRRPVRVLLDGGGGDDAAGERGERDVLIAVDGAHGGRAGDVLRGSDAGAMPDLFEDVDGYVAGLDGGRGDDIVLGGAHGDLIDVWAGADRVRAGGGHDLVRMWPGPRSRGGARVSCGTGFDQVEDVAPLDVLDACEWISAGEDETIFAAAPMRSGGVRVLRSEYGESVRVRLAGGRLVARGSLRRRADRLRLTALGRRIARRDRIPELRVRIDRGGFRLAARAR